MVFVQSCFAESRAVKRQWKESEIEELQSGQEVWEALRTAKRPDIVEVGVKEIVRIATI